MRKLIPVICPICDVKLCKPLDKKNFREWKRNIDQHMAKHKCGWSRRTACFIEYHRYYRYRFGHPCAGPHEHVKVRYAIIGTDWSPEERRRRRHWKNRRWIGYYIPPAIHAFFERMDDYINRMGFLNLVNDVDKRIYAIWLTHPNRSIEQIAKDTNCGTKRVKSVIAQIHIAIQDGLLEEMVEGVL